MSRSALLIVIAFIAATLGSPTVNRAVSMGIIVPAYFYPGTGGPGGVGDGWAAMATAAKEVSITAIFNPNSGPLPGPADHKYVAAMTNLEDAGGKVVAYVYTDNGNTPLATVQSEISTYISQYGHLINGFLLDGMLVTPGTLSYYQSVYGYIKGLNSPYTVIGNPGQPYTNGVSPSDYLGVANILNLFEGTPSGYATYPFGQTWYQNYPSDRFSNVIYGVSGTAAMQAYVKMAAELNAGYVYVTDLSGGNPYNALPSYWLSPPCPNPVRSPSWPRAHWSAR
jgi:hypothetical protein